VITLTERESELVETTWDQLRDAVRKCSNALRQVGVKPNDVVAGFVSNHLESVVAMLATAAVGALWTGISPDNGVSAVLDRLAQIRPTVLFSDNGMLYNGKDWSSVHKTQEIAAALKDVGLKHVVVINNLKSAGLGLGELRSLGLDAQEYGAFLSRCVIHFVLSLSLRVHACILTRCLR